MTQVILLQVSRRRQCDLKDHVQGCSKSVSLTIIKDAQTHWSTFQIEKPRKDKSLISVQCIIPAFFLLAS